jgi:serine/threonine-protein kinase RsbW
LAGGKRPGMPGRDGANRWSFVRHDLPHRLRIWLPSTHPAIRNAVHEVRRLAARCGCPENRKADLEIALREALANAISHGNRLRPGRKVFLRCYGGPRAGIVIAVRDEGNGFDPDAVPDPRSADRRHLVHGRGLLLMRELMDGLEFRRGGSEVVLFHSLRR